MANPLYPFDDDKDTLTKEFEQAVFMDDTEEMFGEEEDE